MKWIEVRLESDEDITEEVSAAFLEMGATGTQIQNPEEIKSMIAEAGAPELADIRDFSKELQNYRVTAYFPSLKNFESIKDALKVKFPDGRLDFREADDSEWNENWKKYYKSFSLTPGLRIIPSWEAEGKPGKNEIIMDPGMAFGTGTHESTELCARLIEENILKGDSFLDIGTGTGILSIVAARNGASGMVAVDIDEAATRTAKINLKINEVEDVLIFQGDLYQAKEAFLNLSFRAAFEFDMVAANIVSDVIIGISPDIKRILKKGGRLVCSGIITERENDVIRQLKSDGFRISEVKRKNEWTAILADA